MKNTSGFINQQADPYLYMEKQTIKTILKMIKVVRPTILI